MGRRAIVGWSGNRWNRSGQNAVRWFWLWGAGSFLILKPLITLLKHFHTVWLKADPQDHMARVLAQGDERPMAGNPDAMNDLQKILTSRESVYNQADIGIDTSGKSIEQSLLQLLEAIGQNNFLHPKKNWDKTRDG